MVHLEG